RGIRVRLSQVLYKLNGRIDLRVLRPDRAHARGVETASKSRPNHRIRRELVRDADPRSKPEVVRLDTHVWRHASDTRHDHLTSGRIKGPSPAGLRRDLGQVVLVTKSVCEGQFASGVPSVL